MRIFKSCNVYLNPSKFKSSGAQIFGRFQSPRAKLRSVPAKRHMPNTPKRDRVYRMPVIRIFQFYKYPKSYPPVILSRPSIVKEFHRAMRHAYPWITQSSNQPPSRNQERDYLCLHRTSSPIGFSLLTSLPGTDSQFSYFSQCESRHSIITIASCDSHLRLLAITLAIFGCERTRTERINRARR